MIEIMVVIIIVVVFFAIVGRILTAPTRGINSLSASLGGMTNWALKRTDELWRAKYAQEGIPFPEFCTKCGNAAYQIGDIKCRFCKSERYPTRVIAEWQPNQTTVKGGQLE